MKISKFTNFINESSNSISKEDVLEIFQDFIDSLDSELVYISINSNSIFISFTKVSLSNKDPKKITKTLKNAYELLDSSIERFLSMFSDYSIGDIELSSLDSIFPTEIEISFRLNKNLVNITLGDIDNYLNTNESKNPHFSISLGDIFVKDGSELIGLGELKITPNKNIFKLVTSDESLQFDDLIRLLDEISDPNTGYDEFSYEIGRNCDFVKIAGNRDMDSIRGNPVYVSGKGGLRKIVGMEILADMDMKKAIDDIRGRLGMGEEELDEYVSNIVVLLME